ncbi:MAG: nucleotidyltransferase domain-containing protein [Planctomycetes bacterium]|nr:nucleotidyltransferase domain-containing protein [Planctomycetota bacterium]
MDRDALIARLKAELATRTPPIAFAYLFGSFGRGDQGPKSDVDLAVFHCAPPDPGLAGPILDLEAHLARDLRREVQVVDLRKAPVDLVFRILRDKVVLVDRDKSARIGFEVHARNEYWDLKPILDLVRKKRRSAG